MTKRAWRDLRMTFNVDMRLIDLQNNVLRYYVFSEAIYHASFYNLMFFKILMMVRSTI